MKKIYALTVLLAATLAANAQHYLGISNSNYSPLNSVYLNPANLADAKHRFQINLFSVNAFVQNDYASLSSRSFINYLKDTENKEFRDLLSYSNNGKNKNLDALGEVRGPSFMVSINPNHGFSINSRVRSFGQASNANSELLSLAVEGFNKADESLYTSILSNKGLAANIHSFAEFSLSYGAVLYNKTKHFVKGGLTAKYLSGLGVGQARNKEFILDFDRNPLNKEVTLLTNKVDLSMGYTDFDQYKDLRVRNLFGKNRIGAGAGFDLGFIYEYRPNPDAYKYEMDGESHIDHSENKYKFKISLSLTDIGRISYKDRAITKNYSLQSNSPTSWTDSEIKKLNFDKLENTLSTKYGSSFNTDGTYKTQLPTTLNLQGDYHIARKFYASGVFIQSLNNLKVPSLYKTLVSVAPRYETRHFEASIPLTYTTKYNQFNVGAAVRAGVFFIGSDDLAGMIGLRKLRSTNLYLGFTIGLAKKRRKDVDGDLISKKFDKCPTDFGPTENGGCPYPDTDEDGVLDKDDQCPTVAGLAQLNGCPDTDNDTIIDSLDACPSEAGTITTKGCPDKDNDGIADKDDNCPNQAGPASNKGCPVKVETVLTKGEEKVVNKAVSNLEFTTGKAIIKSTSYASLDNLAQLLIEKGFKLTLTGHTDNVGSEPFNLKLSKSRAEAVKTYLLKKGVNAENITAEGMGETQPIAPNTTAEGRQKNRRVEFKVE